MKEIHISQSAMSRFRDCPYAWYCYINRKEPMFFNQEVLDIGRYVHDAIDRYYTNHYSNDRTKEQILFKLYDILKEIWDLTLPPEGLKKAYTCLEHFSEWEYKNISKGIENPITEADIYGDGFHGIIDYFDVMSENAIDWKTNTFPVLSYGYKMQSVIYKKLISHEFNVDIKYFNFFFLMPNTWRVVKYDNPKIKSVEKDVNTLYQEMMKCYNEGYFPKKPRTPSLCKNCVYKFYCKVMD